MSPTPPPPVNEPDPSALVCLGSQVGPCAIGRRKTHQYGRGASPLRQWCTTPVIQTSGTTDRHTTRP
ncbi:hypothetical protein [Streptomyces phaeoluteigriseus]